MIAWSNSYLLCVKWDVKLFVFTVHIVPIVHVGCQAAVLLESQKSTADAVADLSSSCFKLNSLQLRALLQNYQPARDELPISPELIERAVVVAQNTADANARREGSEVKLLEDLELQLPFLLPEDGYSCDFVTGCNAELVAFLEPLRHAGITHMHQVSSFVSRSTVFGNCIYHV